MAIECELKTLVFIMPLDERVVISPSFRFESEMCRRILMRNREFIESGVIAEYRREASIEDFWAKKNETYRGVMDISGEYRKVYGQKEIYNEVSSLWIDRVPKQKVIGQVSRDTFMLNIKEQGRKYNVPTEQIDNVLNVNLDNKFTVLDISELSGDLLPIGMFVALDFVWDKAKANRTEEKAIFIDECWQLIGGGSGTFGVGNRLAAEMVLEIFKTIRAYSGSGICATQDLNDFFSLDNGKYGKGIINNCRTKVILNLEDEEAQRVQQVLHLSEAEVMEITHFERGNGLISSNNNNITVEFKASPLERDLITTDRRELLDLLRRMKRPEV